MIAGRQTGRVSRILSGDSVNRQDSQQDKQHKSGFVGKGRKYLAAVFPSGNDLEDGAGDIKQG